MLLPTCVVCFANKTNDFIANTLQTFIVCFVFTV
jgi:hypothetical protein